MFLLVSLSASGLKSTTNKETTIINDNNNEYFSVMRPTIETLSRWEEEYNNAEKAFINPDLVEEIQTTDSYSILDFLDYIPEENNQGACPNCWAWPATSALGIALNVQKGIKDRLSVQFINSCGEEYTSGMYKIECCEGGNLEMFAAFYRATDMAIPWSNTNAYWQDGGLIKCKTTCNSISKTPNYPIYDIRAKTISSRNVPEEEAIANIKNVLHQNKGVYFTVFYPDLKNLNDFRDFWRNQNEEYVYDLDYYCGHPWNEDEAAGHAMLIVGYNDDEGTNNDYWIILNSWGTNSGRPNGLLRVDMHMNYGCKYSNYYAFGTQTLDVSFDPNAEAPEPPSITGPTSGNANTEYTYTISAIDNQGDDVYLYVDWGDGSNSGWLGTYGSGDTAQTSHSWSSSGTYTVKAKAKDTNNKESLWTMLEVSMPRKRLINMPFIEFIKQFDIIYRLILQRIQA